MESLFYIFKLPIVLLGIAVLTLLLALIIPSRVLRNKWSFGVFILQVLVLVVVTWFHVQPKVYPKTYVGQLGELVILSELADRRDFYIGAAVGNEPEMLEYAKKHFNSITPANALKWGRLVDHNDLVSYDFIDADALVNYAVENQLRVRGHVLVWGRAADFFKSPDLRTILKDVPETKIPGKLEFYMKNNIETLLNRYRGKISQWDCVNEPLEVFGGEFDANIYYEYLGKDYIANAFKWAHEVDPSVELYLNEQFDQYDSEKADSFLKYVEELVEGGVPIHGVGIQAHAMFAVPRIEPFRTFLKAISDLGLKIEITELDARLRLFGGHDDPYQAQGDFYEAFVTACLENPLCSGVTIWGVSDRHVWYDGLGVFKLHRPNESNLLDEKMRRKPGYYGIMQALESRKARSAEL